MHHKSSKSKKLPRVTFYNKTNFQSHVEKLCSKARRKLHALVRMSPYMDLRQK